MSGSTITARASHAQLTPRSAPPSESAARTLRIGLLGHGTVGRAFTRLIESRRRRLIEHHRLDVRIATVLVRDAARSRDDAPQGAVVVDRPHAILERDHDVVVEALGGLEPAGTIVAHALGRGTPVVTANKALLAARGDELLVTASRRGVALRGEAAIAAGVPLLGVLEHSLRGVTVDRIDAILNGTSNVVLTEIAQRECVLEDALESARRRGYCEADPALDLSGTDASEKLQILLAALGHAACNPDVRGIRGVGPDDARAARAIDHVLRPVAHATLTDAGPAAWVAPAAVPTAHPLAGVGGRGNAVVLHGEPVGDVVLSGPGAGGAATASALLDDVLAVTAGAASYAHPRSAPAVHVPAPDSSWLVCLGPSPSGPRLDDLVDFVAEAGLLFRSLREVALPDGPVLVGITRPLAAAVIDRATSTILTVGAVRTARAFRALEPRA